MIFVELLVSIFRFRILYPRGGVIKKNINGFWMISLHKPLNDCVVDVYCATGVARVRFMLICHAGLRIPL